MRNLLSNVTISFNIEQSRSANNANGHDAEVFAAARLLLATNGEISWGSRNEDGRKIDLLCSYEHPWYDKERIIFFAQVKSGDTYIKTNISPKKIQFQPFLIRDLLKMTYSICLIWVDRIQQQAYWAYIHSTSKEDNEYKKSQHIISPAFRYDLARCLVKNKKFGSTRGITMSSNPSMKLKEKRKIIYKKYRSYKTLLCPNLGQIEITKIGWRHMFRKSRKLKYKEQSLLVINYLDKILTKQPNAIYVSDCKQEEKNGFTHRYCEYVLKYQGICIFENSDQKEKETEIHIRVAEEIRWDDNWYNNPLQSQYVNRRVVLLNCYHKK